MEGQAFHPNLKITPSAFNKNILTGGIFGNIWLPRLMSQPKQWWIYQCLWTIQVRKSCKPENFVILIKSGTTKKPIHHLVQFLNFRDKETGPGGWEVYQHSV